MSNVYVLEPTKVDTSSAREFGQIRTLFDHGDRRPSIWEPEFGAAVVRALEDEGFISSVDYICVAGHVVALTIAMAAITAHYGEFRALQFNSQSRGYVVVSMGGRRR